MVQRRASRGISNDATDEAGNAGPATAACVMTECVPIPFYSILLSSTYPPHSCEFVTFVQFAFWFFGNIRLVILNILSSKKRILFVTWVEYKKGPLCVSVNTVK